jgi:hypothetical protein
MQATQRLTIQAEITLDSLLQVISRLPFQDKLSLEKALKKQLLQEQMDQFIASAPENVPLSDDDIMAEVKAVRNAGHGAI